MKLGFYPRLAATGIRKNRRVFLPFILACSGMVMMFYIILYLAVSETIRSLIGGGTIQAILGMGSWVIAVFAAIFLFYTNSFLLRRRKKEFGLYNILGMGKWNIARVLFWETLIVAAVSVTAGLAAGIAFSKLAELGLVNITRGRVTYDLSVSFLAVKRSAQVFGVIFLLLLVNSIRQVRFAGAISLLRSENTGEKPPKGNWFVGILGVALLAAAYYLAVTTEDPIAAIVTFFIAVVMVIVGTYLLMIAGSVLFCRILQKNRGYYYKPNHFVSVSSMVYRMKRNGAGLASICILATMVLVMIASTACLYFGGEDALMTRYPREINLKFYGADMPQTDIEKLKDAVAAELEARNVTPVNGYSYRGFNLSGLLDGNTVKIDASDPDKAAEAASMGIFYFVPLEDYNRLMGTAETLAPGEALICADRRAYSGETIRFGSAVTFRVKKQVDPFMGNGEDAMNMIPGITLILPDLEGALEALRDAPGCSEAHWRYHFDTGLEPAKQILLYRALSAFCREIGASDSFGHIYGYVECRENERTGFYGLYGGLFYLGILLSLVFILAAVLIMYYKQISEGYEDQSRFEIMRKVGMTKREIRRSINSQLLTVFFLPLAMAALHIVFAFPIIRRLLLLFGLNNVPLFAATTGITFLVFALFYTVVYRMTSNAYYRIVSGVRGDG